MDYWKTVVPSQLLLERGFNPVVINPGSVNIRVRLAEQDSPFNIPNCIARRTTQLSKLNVQDQLLNSRLTTEQQMEREKAYDAMSIASLLRIPFLDEEVANNSAPRKMGRVDGYNPRNTRNDGAFTWTDIHVKDLKSSVAPDIGSAESQHEGTELKGPTLTEPKFREVICEIKEMLFILLQDLRFSSAVVHQLSFLGSLPVEMLNYPLVYNISFIYNNLRKAWQPFLEMGYRLHVLQIWVLKWHQSFALRIYQDVFFGLKGIIRHGHKFVLIF